MTERSEIGFGGLGVFVCVCVCVGLHCLHLITVTGCKLHSATSVLL